MEKNVSYYVSRKSVFTWLTVVTLLASCVIRIAGAAAEVTEPRFWLVTMPVIAAVWLILIITVNGDELLYKTAVPVGMYIVYYVIKAMNTPYTLKIRLLYSVVYVLIGFLYFEIVTGKFGRRLILGVIIGGGFFLTAWSAKRNADLGILRPVMRELPDILLLLAGIFLIAAMQIHLDGKFHPGWGDRSDGRRIRSIAPLMQVQAFIMPDRNDASNFIADRVEITGIERYIQEKKTEGYKNMGFMHVFLAAYVRAVAKYPGINRFLSGQRIYSRGNDIQFCMVVKNSLTVESEESVLKLHLLPTDTIFDVYDKLNEEIERIKRNPVGGSDFDRTAKLISLMPGLMIRFVVSLIKLLDYFGYVPKFLLDVSPFHCSVFFTSMASLGINPIVHHLYNFGNLPVFSSFGAKYTENETERDGNVVRRRYIDYTFNTDERIVDGFYYATVFKYIKRLLNHPESLELTPAEVNQDIE